MMPRRRRAGKAEANGGLASLGGKGRHAYASAADCTQPQKRKRTIWGRCRAKRMPKTDRAPAKVGGRGAGNGVAALTGLPPGLREHMAVLEGRGRRVEAVDSGELGVAIGGPQDSRPHMEQAAGRPWDRGGLGVSRVQDRAVPALPHGVAASGRCAGRQAPRRANSGIGGPRKAAALLIGGRC